MGAADDHTGTGTRTSHAGESEADDAPPILLPAGSSEAIERALTTPCKS